MMDQPVEKKARSVEWGTPRRVLDPVDRFCGGQIGLDPATTPDNPTRARVFFTRSDDGLGRSWREPGVVFVNPPYGGGTRFQDWCRKIDAEARLGQEILALLPCGARFSTRYFQDYILSSYLEAVCFIRGRVKFIPMENQKDPGNNYDSALYGFNVNPDRFAEHFTSLGVCIGGWLGG